MDQRALVPITSGYSHSEDILSQSSLPSSHVLPPILTLRLRRLEAASPTTAKTSTECTNEEFLFAAFVPLIVPHHLAKDLGVVNCSQVGDLFCDVEDFLEVLPESLQKHSSLVQGQLQSVQQQLCPQTCGDCGKKDLPVLTDQFFQILRGIDYAFADAVKAVGDQMAQQHPGQLRHIGRFGNVELSASEARTYVHGLDVRPDQLGHADKYRRHFSSLSSVDGEGTMVQVLHPFKPMSAEAATFGKSFLTNLRQVSGLEDLLDADNASTQFSLMMHEQPFWEEVQNMEDAIAGATLSTTILLLILVGVIFRSMILPPRLLLTVLLTLGVAFGACSIVIDFFGLPGIFWIVPAMTVPVVVGLTLDYDFFILTRVMELRLDGFPTELAFEVGLAKTRGIISVAGIIMSLAFSALCTSEVLALRQIGVVLVVATLCDTFVIRPLVVPACALAFGDPEVNWWPRRMPAIDHSRATHPNAVQERELVPMEYGMRAGQTDLDAEA
jgi:hypothetical protein